MKGDNLAFGEGPGGLRPQQTQLTVQEEGVGRGGARVWQRGRVLRRCHDGNIVLR